LQPDAKYDLNDWIWRLATSKLGQPDYWDARHFLKRLSLRIFNWTRVDEPISFAREKRRLREEYKT
jgi:hypothetical protein